MPKALTYDPTSAGSYSVSDEGCVGDVYAISPQAYPVPGYLRMYQSLKKALKVATDTCALQQGVCWVVRRSQTLPRCGQRCGPGECGPSGAPYSPGLAGYGAMNGLRDREFFAFKPFPDSVRRSVQAEWKPIARVSLNGVDSVLPDGCVLPLWQRVFYVGDMNNSFARGGDPMLYQAAVQAAMYFARTQGKTKVINGRRSDGKIVPVVYVEPGGIVRSASLGSVAKDYAVQVRRMDDLEMQQALVLSQGASVMPFNM